MATQWYEKNFPIDPTLTDCRNCCEHMPPELADDCVKCTLMDAHVLCNKALDCISFAPFITNLNIIEKTEEYIDEVEYPTLVKLLGLDQKFGDKKEITTIVEAKEEKKDESQPEKQEMSPDWKPQSQLDSKLTTFDYEATPAALRAMFDILKAMEKRLTKIEEKMPSKMLWEIKNFFSKRKKDLTAKKYKYKWKFKGKIRKIKEKVKKKKTKLKALFAPKKEPEEKKEIKTT